MKFGLSAATVGMLGASHHHTEAQRADAAMRSWQDFRRTAHAPLSQPAEHSHAALLRHHHAEGDASVVALDGDGGDALQGGAAPVTLILGNHIPGSIQTVHSLVATAENDGPWSGHVQLRYFGPRPLDENNASRSKATTLACLRVVYKINKNARVAVDVFNRFNREGSGIDHCYSSRLKGEPAAGVNDVHFHPVEPRSVRVTLNGSFRATSNRQARKSCR